MPTIPITVHTLHHSQGTREKFLSWGAVGDWGVRYAAGTEQMSTPAFTKGNLSVITKVLIWVTRANKGSKS